MDPVNQITQYLGQIIIAAGGGVLIGLGLFKVYGGKWLDAHFGRRLIDLKAEHDRQLQDLKSVHDASLRHIQSTIDREIHRAKKLYDREFETLAEAWRLLCKAYDNGMSCGADRYPSMLERYSDGELNDLMDRTTMRDFEKQEMRAMHPDSRTEHFRRWGNAQRHAQYANERMEFRTFVRTNAIFFSSTTKEKFLALDDLIGGAIAEFEGRIRHPHSARYDEVAALSKNGSPLLAELEVFVRERMWSAENQI